MTPPLPIRLKRAEVRIAGKVVSVSAHGLTVRTELEEPTAKAIWSRLGTTPGQVSLTVTGDVAGAELIRLSDRSRGLRVWIGPNSFRRPLLRRWWDEFFVLETGVAEPEEVPMEVADVA